MPPPRPQHRSTGNQEDSGVSRRGLNEGRRRERKLVAQDQYGTHPPDGIAPAKLESFCDNSAQLKARRLFSLTLSDQPRLASKTNVEALSHQSVPMRSLNGAVIALVGAAGGIGRELAQLLTDRGAVLLLVGRNADRLQGISDGCASGTTHTIVCDIRDSTAGDSIIKKATEIGRLDGVINASGVVAFGSLIDTPDEIIEELFLTNVLGPLWMIKRVAPVLAASKGFLVNISAVVAESPMANMAAYSASKAALTAADIALTRELRRSGITVCDVRPPHTETDLAKHPIAGTAPNLPTGITPHSVAETIVRGVEAGLDAIPANAFQ